MKALLGIPAKKTPNLDPKFGVIKMYQFDTAELDVVADRVFERSLKSEDRK